MTFRALSGEQRYQQAQAKAHVLARRQLRQFLAGQISVLPQIPYREFLIEELDRAYRAGVEHGRAQVSVTL